MRVTVKATNLTLTPALATFLDEKLEGVARAAARIEARGVARRATPGHAVVVARVELARTTRHHRKGDIFRAEITLDAPGRQRMRVEAMSPDLRVAITEARNELRRAIRSHKEKRAALVRRGGREFKRRARLA